MSRIVAVTGGAKGIGLTIVSQFLALGDEVVAIGRDRDALAQGPARAAMCDVTDEYQVAATFHEIGRVDVLVNNAGVGERTALQDTATELWRRHLDVNATGAFLCLQAVLPAMRKRGSGVIVNVASTTGLVGVANAAAYTASKHALVGLTRAAAAELAGTGIRVNAVCPGTEGIAASQVADAVVWLASDAAQAISGQAIVIDGGGG